MRHDDDYQNDNTLDSFAGEDWKGWIAGKYDNRYEGVRRYDNDYNYHPNRRIKRGIKSLCIILIFVISLPLGLDVINAQEQLDQLRGFTIFGVNLYGFYSDDVSKKFHEIIGYIFVGINSIETITYDIYDDVSKKFHEIIGYIFVGINSIETAV